MPRSPGGDRSEPLDQARDDANAVEIDLERVVWDPDYRREIARRLGPVAALQPGAPRADP